MRASSTRSGSWSSRRSSAGGGGCSARPARPSRCGSSRQAARAGRCAAADLPALTARGRLGVACSRTSPTRADRLAAGLPRRRPRPPHRRQARSSNPHSRAHTPRSVLPIVSLVGLQPGRDATPATRRPAGVRRGPSNLSGPSRVGEADATPAHEAGAAWRRGGGVGQDVEFQEFFAGQYEALCRLGYWLAGDHAEGEELAQEALVRGLDRPLDYTRKVLVNRYRSLLRRALVEARHAGRARAEAAEQADHDGSLVLWAAVRRLPLRQRAVTVLRYQEDLPEAEVARLLGCSVGTVKSNASRALARLRTELGRESGDLARHTEQGERR